MRDDGTIAAEVRREIEARLDRIVAEEGVRLLLAVESGSRAWGFPSPDSDYDVRFVYVRARDDYLALAPPRDVIERPIVDAIDLSGWDVRKALGPPMDLAALVAGSALPAALTDTIAALVAAKRRTNERGNAARHPALDGLIAEELARAGELPAKSATLLRPRADRLFRDLVNA